MAGLEAASYTALGDGRQTRRPQIRPALAATLLFVSVTLGGCSTIRPLSGWMSSSNAPPADEITTGSIPKPTVVQTAPDSDGEIIRRTVEAAAKGEPAVKLEWSNPASGNSGTITDLAASRARNGAPCRDFATTLATIEGVSLYRGRACQGYAGPWDLVDFAPADGTAPG